MKFNFATLWRSSTDGLSLPGDGKQRAEEELGELHPRGGARGVGGGRAAVTAPRETVQTQAQPLAHTPCPACLAAALSLWL